MTKMYLMFCLVILAAFSYSFGQKISSPRNKKTQTVAISQDSSGFRVLVDSGYYYLFKPGEESSDMQTAKAYSSKALALSRRLSRPAWESDLHLLNAMIFRENGKSDEAKLCFEKALGGFKRYGNLVGEGKVLMEKRHFFALTGKEMQERILLVKKAATLFRKAGSHKDEGDARRELGDLFQIQSEYANAIVELKKSLTLYQKAKNPELQGVYDLISISHTALGIHDEALKYGLLALKTAKAVGDSGIQLCTIFNRLSITYLALEDYEKSYEYHRKSMDVAVRLKDENTIAMISIGSAMILSQDKFHNYNLAIKHLNSVLQQYPSMSVYTRLPILCELVRYYDELKNHKESRRYFDQVLKIYQSKNDLNDWLKTTFYRTATLHGLATRQLALAEKYILIYRDYLQKTSRVSHLASNYLWSSKLDSLRGNYLSALGHYQRHKTLMDTVFSQQKQKQIAMLNVRFDMERKDQDLKAKAQNIGLLTKRAVLQQELLQKAQTNRNITAAFLVLSVLFLTLLYNRYRIKQRTNLAIAATNQQLQKIVNEREWLIRELHHRVKNNLQTIMSLLESQSAYLQDDALAAVKESQHRVQAMSLIHQKLYLTDNLATINMPNYIWDLTEHLLQSFPSRNCKLSLDLDAIDLDVANAIPVALILNEAITNSLKYAFLDGRKGVISVSMKKQNGTSSIVLIIDDNGVGIPKMYIRGKQGAMGLKLMYGLAGELGGYLSICGGQGTQIRLEFDDRPTLKHSSDRALGSSKVEL